MNGIPWRTWWPILLSLLVPNGVLWAGPPFKRGEARSDHFELRYPPRESGEAATILTHLESLGLQSSSPHPTVVILEGTNQIDHPPHNTYPPLIYPQYRASPFELLFQPDRWQVPLLRYQAFLQAHAMTTRHTVSRLLFTQWRGARLPRAHPLLDGLALYLEEAASRDRVAWGALRALALRQLSPKATPSPNALPKIFPFNPDLGRALIGDAFWQTMAARVSPEVFAHFVTEAQSGGWRKAFPRYFGGPWQAAWRQFLAHAMAEQGGGPQPAGLAQQARWVKGTALTTELTVAPNGRYLAYIDRQVVGAPPILKVRKGDRWRRFAVGRILPTADSVKWLDESDGVLVDSWRYGAGGHRLLAPRLLTLHGKGKIIGLPYWARHTHYWKRQRRLLFLSRERGVENFALAHVQALDRPTPLTSNTSSSLYFNHPVTSVGANRLLFTTADERGHETVILYDLGSGDLHKLLPQATHQVHPQWAIGESHVLYSAEVAGRFGIFAVRPEDQALYRIATGPEDLFWPTIAEVTKDRAILRAMSLFRGQWRMKEMELKLPLFGAPTVEVGPVTSVIPSGAPSASTPMIPLIVPPPPAVQVGAWVEPVERGVVVGARAHWIPPNFRHDLALYAGWQTEAQRPVGGWNYRYTGITPFLEFEGGEWAERVTIMGEEYHRAHLQTGLRIPIRGGRVGLGFGYALDGANFGGGLNRRWFSGPYLDIQIPFRDSGGEDFIPRKSFRAEVTGHYWIDTFTSGSNHHPEAIGRVTGMLPFGRVSLVGAAELGYTRDIGQEVRFFELGGDLSYLTTAPRFLVRGYDYHLRRSQAPLVGHLELRYLIADPDWGPPFARLKALSVAAFGDAANPHFTRFTRNAEWLIGAGVEGRAHLLFAKQVPLLLRVGWHHGFNMEGRGRFFVGLGRPWF